MKEVFLDTNIFLRFFVDDEGKQHRGCIRLFELMEAGKVRGIICSVIVLEIYFTLKSFYRFSNKKCEKLLRRILTANNLKIIDSFDYDKALELFTNTGIKFADCLIASLKFFEKGGTIVSYDKDFDRLGVKRIEPTFSFFPPASRR